jgi:hypothetical protein
MAWTKVTEIQQMFNEFFKLVKQNLAQIFQTLTELKKKLQDFTKVNEISQKLMKFHKS